jgi:hypothetical protein
MAKQTNNLRERLLAALPQPENLSAYHEETAMLLAKHARALRWDYFTAYALVVLAALLFLWSFDAGQLGATAVHSFRFGSGVLYFVGAIYVVRYHIYDSQVATLKEIKQVQLQVLELQGLLKRDGVS